MIARSGDIWDEGLQLPVQVVDWHSTVIAAARGFLMVLAGQSRSSRHLKTTVASLSRRSGSQKFPPTGVVAFTAQKGLTCVHGRCQRQTLAPL